MVEPNEQPKPPQDSRRKSLADGESQSPDSRSDSETRSDLGAAQFSGMQLDFVPIEGLDSGEVRTPVPIWTADEISTDADAAQAKIDAQPTVKPTRIGFLRLGLSLIVFALVGYGVHRLHQRQMETLAVSLREQADRARQQGQQDLYLRYLTQYIAYADQDADALAELADARIARVRTGQQLVAVFLMLERVCRLDPDQHESRRRLVEIAMELGRYDDALAHLKLLETAIPDDAHLKFLAGRCYEQEEKYTNAVQRYQASVEQNPRQLEAYERLARVLDEQMENRQQGLAVLDQMVAANPDSEDALLIRAQFQLEAGDLAAADRDIGLARDMSPNSLEVQLMAARVAAAGGETSAIQSQFLYDQLGKALESNADDRRLYQTLASLDLARGRTAEARQWFVRALEVLPDDHEFRVQLVSLLIDLNELSEAELELERLRSSSVPQSWVRATRQCLDGYLQLRKRNWRTAASMLEEVLTQLDDLPFLQKWINLRLVQCYRDLGNNDAVIAACRRILNDDSSSLDARLELAAAQAAEGRLDDAIANYRVHIDAAGVPIDLAVLLIRKQLQLPPAQRNWQSVEQAIDEAEKAMPDSPDVVILRARLSELQANVNDGLNLLTQAAAQNPDELRYVLSLIAMAQRNGREELVRTTLDAADRTFGDQIALRLARLEHLQRQGGDIASDALLATESHLEEFSEKDRWLVVEHLARAWDSLGHADAAARLWNRLAETQTADLNLQLIIFRAALKSDDSDMADATVERIIRIEGDQGPHVTACRIERHICQAEQGEKERLVMARQLLASLREQRPNWWVAAALQGRIDDVQGNMNAAVKHYREAIETGSPDPQLLSRLAQVLFIQRRFSEADAVLRQFEFAESISVTPGLIAMSSQVAMRLGDLDRALALAERWFRIDPVNPQAHLWAGQLYAARNESARALERFEKSAELQPEDSSTWIALIQHCVRTGDTERARDAVERAGEVLSPDDAPLLFARYFEVVGDAERAQERYAAALAQNPDDPFTLQAVSDYQSRQGRSAASIPLLRRLIELEVSARRKLAVGMPAAEYDRELQLRSVDLTQARRQLAAILSRGDYRQSQEALQLLESNPDAETNPQDLSLKARTLAGRSLPRDRQQAMRILTSLEQRGSITPDDALLLAQLTDATGQPRAADKRWNRLINDQHDHPGIIAAAAGRDLRLGRPDDAVTNLDRLRKLSTDPTLILSVAVPLAVLRGDLAAASTQLDTWIDEGDSELTKAGRIAQAAGLLEEMTRSLPGVDGASADELLVAAEQRYRELLKLNPASGPELAAFLERRQRFQEAFEVCEQTWSSGNPDQVAAVWTALVNSGTLTDHATASIASRLQNLVDENPESTMLWMHLANLMVLLRQPAEAEQAFRRVLAIDPDNVLAINNLTWLLAVQHKDIPEAERLIDSAIQRAGPQRVLLDTKSVVLLAASQPQAAINLLQEALLQEDSPITYFHLAQAWQAMGNEQKAEASFRRAVTLGLSEDDFEWPERASFDTLQQQFGDK